MAEYEYISSTGVIIPDTSDIQSEVEAEYQEVYGDDISLDTSTEQGREIAAEVSARSAVVRNNAEVSNQINPNLAENIFLDAVYALFNGERDGAERSTVTCLLSGAFNTIVPANSRVQDDDGNLWFLASSEIIGSNGTVEASFRSVEYGVINAAIGAITQIVDGALGWETVTNEVAATPGKEEQTDVSARIQMKRELAGNAVNNTAAIMTAISKVENVASLTFRENLEGYEQTIDNVTLKRNSTYVCVDGGSDGDVALAYYKSRSGGAGFNGSQSYTVTDENSLQEIDVLFDRPTVKPVIATVSVKSSSGTLLTSAIQQAVVDYADGLIADEEGFVLGADISPFEIAAAINSSIPGLFVSQCKIAFSGETPSTDTLPIEIYEKGSITASAVTVTIL